MADTWKRLDLGGGGLQEANLRLARALRRRSSAYLWWLAFACGAHRAYLHDRPGAFGFAGLSAVVVATALLGAGGVATALAALEAVWAAADLVWIDRRVTALNKQLRMAAYLRPGPGAPAGYRGRLADADSPSGNPDGR